MEKTKNVWSGGLTVKDLQSIADDMKRRKKQTAEVIQTVYNTQTGRDFIRWLVVETRMFALGLGVIDNLRRKYNMSTDYYTGQTDLIKKVLEFMTPEQVADLTAAIVKETVEKKEEKYGNDKVA